ncbi:MAG: adenylate/guanylate cyclase domain-containing protein [Acidimicrobiia bacterium]
MTQLPTGTVTFFFSDIEGSTALLQRFGADASALLDAHDAILEAAIDARRGTTLRTEGDSFFAVFASAPDAVAAAVDAQRSLAAHPWPDDGQVRVRIGLHTGAGELGGADYRGIDVHRAARIGAAAHGGQIIISESTAALLPLSPDAPELIELGAHQFKDLLQPIEIHQVVADGLDRDFPHIRSLDATTHNLPAELTSFVPRPEVGRITALLDSRRFVTLTGPGGTGKTRLALQVAAEASDDFEAVYYVPLAPVTDPELVAATIASTLGLTRSSASAERLVIDYFKGHRTLLVLDNFEQILDAAPLVARLIAAADGLKVLVTSRAALQLSGEQEFPVPPLALPNGETSVEALSKKAAVVLFVDRAAASLPDFTLTDDNASAVAEITRRLDGLPLAIELAASRVKVLAPRVMAERLRASFDVLSTTRRDLPARQQTLRNAIAWSYDLLSPTEQRLLRGMSVFRGGAVFEAIDSVCGRVLGDEHSDVLDPLEVLVHHSLVRYDPTQPTPRYAMLETIREFAWQRLTETDDCRAIQDAHLDTHVELAEEVGPHLTGPEQAYWLDAVQRERDNFRAAFAFAEESGRFDAAARIVSSLWRYLQARGLIPEGRDFASRVLVADDLDDALRLRVISAAGSLAYWAADMDDALRHYEAAVALARTLGEPRALAEALYDFAFPHLLGDRDHDAAHGALDEAAQVFAELGDSHGAARVTWARGVGAMYVDQPHLALEATLDALPDLEAAGDMTMVAWSHHMATVALLAMDRIDEALPHIKAALDLFEPVRDIAGLTLQLQNLNQLSLRTGDQEQAVIMAGAVANQQHATGMNLSEVAANAVLGLEEAYDALGEQRAGELFDQGMNTSLAEALALAREITG